MERALRDEAGGILGLVRLLSEHGEAVSADLRSEYGVRLSDLFARDSTGRPLLTWRELGGYVRQLPPRARTRIAMGDTDGLYGLQEHLQALTIDELRVANWQRANEGVKPSKQTKPPKPMPRPGVGRGKDKNHPERVAKRKAALERAAERRRALAHGEIT
ncbi:hypothetical protein [Streptomyces flaveolus]|uniref:hypothetical protein n=1 Tax=Streptomyces flaveolus TaxID=67297 RepID=UPI0036FF9F38